MHGEVRGAHRADGTRLGRSRSARRADRVEIGRDGRLDIVDYKTGPLPTQQRGRSAASRRSSRSRP